METFWFFWLHFRRAYDFSYDSNIWFSSGHKHSYDSAYDSNSDSVATENQPQGSGAKDFSLAALGINDINGT